jgi:hypothetical protein
VKKKKKVDEVLLFSPAPLNDSQLERIAAVLTEGRKGVEAGVEKEAPEGLLNQYSFVFTLKDNTGEACGPPRTKRRKGEKDAEEE